MNQNILSNSMIDKSRITSIDFLFAWNTNKQMIFRDLNYNPKIDYERMFYCPHELAEIIIEMFAKAYEKGGIVRLEQYMNLSIFHKFYTSYYDIDTLNKCVYKQLVIYVLQNKIKVNNNDLEIILQKSIVKVKLENGSRNLNNLLSIYMYYANQLDHIILLFNNGCSRDLLKFSGETKYTQIINHSMKIIDQDEIQDEIKNMIEYLHNKGVLFGPIEFKCLFSFKPYTKYQQTIYNYLEEKKYISTNIFYHQTIFDFIKTI